MVKKTFIVSYLKCGVGMRSAQSFRLREGRCHTVVSHNLRFRATADGIVVENLRRRLYPWEDNVAVGADKWLNVMAGPTATFRVSCFATQTDARNRSAWWVRQEHTNELSSIDTRCNDVCW